MVAGRVVDRKGKPVFGALVSIIGSPCIGCHDRIIPSTKTDIEGLFALPIDGKVNSVVSVLIEQEVPHGFWSPFAANDLALLKAGFRGIPIKIRSRQATIQLGDVRPTVEYKKVVTDISKLFHIDNAELDLKSISITVVRGNVVVFKDIPIAGGKLSSSVVHLALPTGSWGILFSVQRGSNRIDEQFIVP